MSLSQAGRCLSRPGLAFSDHISFSVYHLFSVNDIITVGQSHVSVRISHAPCTAANELVFVVDVDLLRKSVRLRKFVASSRIDFPTTGPACMTSFMHLLNRFTAPHASEGIFDSMRMT